MSRSPANESVHEFSVKIGADVIVDESFFLLEFFGLVMEYCVFVPSFGEGVGRVNQGIAFEEFGLSVGHGLFVLLLSLSRYRVTLWSYYFYRCYLIL